MDKLFSPWRSKYIESFSQPKKHPDSCILCDAYQRNNDDETLIVTRGVTCFVIMNLYPYNSGHLMIVPFKHTSELSDLTDTETLEVMSLLKKMQHALKEIANPDGYNIGSNLGKVAGAGIDQHIHFHIVPRWNGDTNFMPVLGDTKLISEDMRDTLKKLRSVL